MNRSAYSIYYNHFAARLAERYGLIATDRLYNDIIQQIQNRNKHTRVASINRQRSIHCVYVNGQRVFVVYRKSKKALITALPVRKYLITAFEQQKMILARED